MWNVSGYDAAMLLAFLFIAMAVLSGSSQADPAGTPCTEPRPQACTMEYLPVCAMLASGGEKTFSNGCAACSDAGIESWIDGACPE